MDPIDAWNLDPSQIIFQPATHKQERSYVDLRYGTSSRNDIRIRFCKPGDHLYTKFRLDEVRDGGNATRRGLALKVHEERDKALLEVFQKLDKHIVDLAVERSKEWFKKSLTREQVEARYKKIVDKYRDEDDHYMLKIKVKLPDETGRSNQIPTVLHLEDEEGNVVPRAGRAEHLSHPGGAVNPIVSTREIWFMPGGSFGLSFQAENMIVCPGKPRDELADFGMSSDAKRRKLDTEDKEVKTVTLEGEDGAPSADSDFDAVKPM
jgi:hypothetical protein